MQAFRKGLFVKIRFARATGERERDCSFKTSIKGIKGDLRRSQFSMLGCGYQVCINNSKNLAARGCESVAGS